MTPECGLAITIYENFMCNMKNRNHRSKLLTPRDFFFCMRTCLTLVILWTSPKISGANLVGRHLRCCSRFLVKRRVSASSLTFKLFRPHGGVGWSWDGSWVDVEPCRRKEALSVLWRVCHLIEDSVFLSSRQRFLFWGEVYYWSSRYVVNLVCVCPRWNKFLL